MTPDLAATTALNGLAYLVGSGEGLDRFLSLSGIDPATLRARVDETDFLVSVLDFLLADEELLVGFCDTTSIDVRAVHMARHILGSG